VECLRDSKGVPSKITVTNTVYLVMMIKFSMTRSDEIQLMKASKMNKLKKAFITTLLVVVQLLLFCQDKKEDFVGKWEAPKGAIIIVSILDDAFIGKTENENAVVLKDVEFSQGKWRAVVLNPKENIIAKCELILYPTKIKIIARKGLFRKTIYWKKV
jgi:hypothetical protein